MSVQNTWSALFWFYCLNTSDCFPTQILGGGGVSSEHWELLKAFGFKNFHNMTFFSSGQDSCSSHVSHNFLIFNKNKRIPNTSIQVAWLGSFLQKYFCAVDILTWSTVCLRPNADTWRANSVNSITYWLSTQSKSCFFLTQCMYKHLIKVSHQKAQKQMWQICSSQDSHIIKNQQLEPPRWMFVGLRGPQCPSAQGDRGKNIPSHRIKPVNIRGKRPKTRRYKPQW